jgi:hypothetical protein
MRYLVGREWDPKLEHGTVGLCVGDWIFDADGLITRKDSFWTSAMGEDGRLPESRANA